MPLLEKVKWLKNLKMRARLDEKTFVKAVNSCGKGPPWQRALHLLDVMQEDGLEPRAAAFTAAIRACSGSGPDQDKRRETALELFARMKMWGIRPYDGTCASLVACDGLGEWPFALGRVWQMRTDGLKRLPRAYINAASACESSMASWTISLELLETARQSTSTLSDSTVVNLPEVLPCQMSAFARGKHWSFAIRSHVEAKRQQVEIELETYNELLRACSLRVGHWQRVLALLGEMSESDLVPNADSYEAALTCCSNASEWAWVVQLYEELALFNLPRERFQTLAAHASQRLGDKRRMQTLAETTVAVN